MSNRSYLIAEQSQFYRNNYRKLVTIAFIFVAFIFAFIAYFVYVDFNTPERDYFATTSSGQVIKIQPIPAPN